MMLQKHLLLPVSRHEKKSLHQMLLTTHLMNIWQGCHRARQSHHFWRFFLIDMYSRWLSVCQSGTFHVNIRFKYFLIGNLILLYWMKIYIIFDVLWSYCVIFSVEQIVTFHIFHINLVLVTQFTFTALAVRNPFHQTEYIQHWTYLTACKLYQLDLNFIQRNNNC